VSGINIEDGPDSSDLTLSKIEAVRKQAMNAGIDVFINARTDVYLRNPVSGRAAVAAASDLGGCRGVSSFRVPAGRGLGS
jgi:hypothetical protein